MRLKTGRDPIIHHLSRIVHAKHSKAFLFKSFLVEKLLILQSSMWHANIINYLITSIMLEDRNKHDKGRFVSLSEILYLE